MTEGSCNETFRNQPCWGGARVILDAMPPSLQRRHSRHSTGVAPHCRSCVHVIGAARGAWGTRQQAEGAVASRGGSHTCVIQIWWCARSVLRQRWKARGVTGGTRTV